MPRLNLKPKRDEPAVEVFAAESDYLSPEGLALVMEVEQLADELLAPEKELAEPMTRNHARTMRRVANGFYCAVVALSLLLGVTLLLNAFAVNGVMGLRFFVEPTNAMLKQVPYGSLLITVMRPSDKINPGDIITYNVLQDKDNRDIPGTRLTRIVDERLVSNNITIFRTKRAGDAAPDSIPINMSNILGVKVAVIPLAGHVVSFIQTYAAGLAVLAAALCVAAVVLRRWAGLEHPGLKRKRGKKRRRGLVRHAG